MTHGRKFRREKNPLLQSDMDLLRRLTTPIAEAESVQCVVVHDPVDNSREVAGEGCVWGIDQVGDGFAPSKEYCPTKGWRFIFHCLEHVEE